MEMMEYVGFRIRTLMTGDAETGRDRVVCQTREKTPDQEEIRNVTIDSRGRAAGQGRRNRTVTESGVRNVDPDLHDPHLEIEVSVF